MAILYAEKKYFMDSSQGIRMEDYNFKVFKCSLPKLIEVGKKLEPSATKDCHKCGKKQGEPGVQLLGCGKCKLAFYCSKECQASHWRDVHRGLCGDMTLLKRLVLLLHSPFADWTSFHQLQKGL